MEIWPVFDILHRLWLYLCHKRGVLGFYKQTTHRRPGDAPFLLWGLLFMTRDGPKKVHFWSKMAGLSTFHSGPKRTKMVNQSVFLNLGPFWAHLDPFDHFRQKMIFCSEAEVKVPWKNGLFCHYLAMNGKLWVQNRFSSDARKCQNQLSSPSFD